MADAVVGVGRGAGADLVVFRVVGEGEVGLEGK